MNRLNKRRHERHPSSAPVAFRWRDDSGETRFGHGTVLDYSKHGLRVELLEAVEVPSYVLVAPQGKNRTACAGTARYCVTRQTKYVVGLEFGADAENTNALPEISEVLQNPQFSMLMFRP